MFLVWEGGPVPSKNRLPRGKCSRLPCAQVNNHLTYSAGCTTATGQPAYYFNSTVQ